MGQSIYRFVCNEALFWINTDHANAFVQTWYGFKLSQPITKSNSHFLFTVQSATSLFLVQQPKRIVCSYNRRVRHHTAHVGHDCVALLSLGLLYHPQCWLRNGSNKEVVVAVRGWFRKQEPDFCSEMAMMGQMLTFLREPLWKVVVFLWNK